MTTVMAPSQNNNIQYPVGPLNVACLAGFPSLCPPGIVATAQVEAAAWKALNNGANPATLWTKLFVGGLPYHSTDEELRQHFKQFGEIREAAVIYEKETKQSKGYGFVSTLQHVSFLDQIGSRCTLIEEQIGIR